MKYKMVREEYPELLHRTEQKWDSLDEGRNLGSRRKGIRKL
jgi:hypothetical protein